MNFNKYYQEEVSIESLEAYQAFVTMAGAGYTSPFYGSALPVYSSCLSCSGKHGKFDWITLVSDQKRIGSFIVNKHLKDKKYFYGLHRRWHGKFQKIFTFYYQEFPENISKLTDVELEKKIENLTSFYLRITMAGFLDGFMFYADKRFYNLLQEFCEKKKINDCAKIFSILSAPIEPSFLTEEEEEMRIIIRKIKQAGHQFDKNLKKSILNDEKMRKLVNNHLLKYSWIKSSYAGYIKYELDDFIKQAKEVVNIGQNDKPYKRSKKLKLSLIKKYGFTPEIIAIAELTELFIKWQDQRKIYTLTFISLLDKYLREISSRKRIDLGLLRNTRLEEFKKVTHLDKKLLASLETRLKPFIFVYANGKVKEVIIGECIDKIMAKIKKDVDKNIKEIPGMAASLGKVQGKARIIMTAKNIAQVQKGEILVAPMTRPEHLPGMKKAVAIITDDGGITCHAAIVARELGIPCIIGTKIATKVLHDGDLVEVDANKGIVKIIK